MKLERYYDSKGAIDNLIAYMEHALIDLKGAREIGYLSPIDYKMKVLIKEIIEYYKIYESIDLLGDE
jgi:hypothetical protein